jgi:two-component system sensor kinase FixL
LRKDGSSFPAEVRVRIRKEQGRTIRVTALRDLTKAKAAEAEIQAQRAELEMTRRLALISEISAGIIHQISQPLTSMGVNLAAATSILQSDQNRSRQLGEILGEVEDDVTRMRQIVKHLRRLGNPLDLFRVSMDLNSAIAEAIPLLQSGAEKQSIAIGVELDKDLPLVTIDWVQMSQVVLNLTRNAIEACADCDPERRVVTIRTRALDREAVEMSVSDFGCGILPEVRKSLFSSLVTTKPNGFGVGLRLSQTIVHAHNGSITGENNPDGFGAIFRVVLPIEESWNHTKV